MKYNIDGMGPKQPNIFKRAWQSITFPHYGRTIGFLTLLVIALSVPATIAFLGKPTNLQQKASEQLPSDSPSGKIEVFNGRGDAALAMNGKAVINSTSNAIQLKITAPQGSTLVGKTTKAPLSKFSFNIVNPALASHISSHTVNTSTACNGTNQDITATWNLLEDAKNYKAYLKDQSGATIYSGCLAQNTSSYTFTNRPATNSYEVGVINYHRDPGDPECTYPYWQAAKTSVTNAQCSGGGGGSPPTATPTQAAAGSLTCAQGNCSACITQNNICGQHSYDTCDYSTCNNGGTTYRCYASQNPNGCSFSQYSCSLCSGSQGGGGSSPTATPTPVAGGSGIFPAPGAQINENSVQLRWNTTTGATPYHVRVNNQENQTALAVDVWREPNCPNNLFVCTETTNNWLNLIQLPNGNYDWWVDLDGNQIVHSNFSVTGQGGGSAPTATPTTAPANPSTQIVAIAMQNLPDSDQSGSLVKTITDAAQLSRILHGTEKVGWNIALPDFTQDLTAQDKIVEVTFWYAGNRADGKNYVKTTQVVKYADYAMRFDSGIAGQPAKVGQKLYVYIYGNEPTINVKIKLPNNDIIPLPAPGSPEAAICTSETGSPCGVISPVTDGVASTPTIAWKIRIPGEKITVPGKYVITFFSTSTAEPNVERARVTEAIEIAPENGQSPTATSTPPGAQAPGELGTPTPTVTPRPTVTPGGPTVTPTVAPTATPVPTATPSITPPPPGPASVTFKVILSGIGVKTTKGTDSIVNDKPNQRKRDATLYLYAPDVDATGDFAGAKAVKKIPQPKGQAIEYDDNGKFVAANFNLGDTFVPGQYQIFVWTPGYLRKRIPGTQNLKVDTNTINQVVTLTLGDADNNNHLDTLDFREYRSCLNQQTTACLKADFNDDGYIDNDDKHNGKEGNNKPSFLDYNLFVSQFALVNGD